MEYAARGNLHAFLKAQKGKPLPEKLVWKLFARIALGLHYLHSRNVRLSATTPRIVACSETTLPTFASCSGPERAYRYWRVTR
jgi:serine/threonine protein kinase